MRIIRSPAVMQRLALRWRREGVRAGLVPTMGYLHAGHLSLVARARKLTGARGKVVVSIYVNPTQFGPAEDFSKYPRDMARDARLCRESGVDVVFAPDDKRMYAGRDDGTYSTYVVEEQLSREMEGTSRPTHFRGVTTVVAKLLNLVLPEWAVFGAKDCQQAAIIRRMVRNLNFATRIIVAPTIREKDGLAMSSRNKYLEGDLRRQALVLARAINSGRRAVREARKPIPATRLRDQLAAEIGSVPSARLDYISFFDPETLQPAISVAPGTQMALAVYIGQTRLIDNARL